MSTTEELEGVFGPPSQAGFGSAVFTSTVAQSDDLEAAAREHYRRFVGDSWERFGEDAWMGPWALVHSREPRGERDVVAELSALEDRSARSSSEMLLDGSEDPERARRSLAAAFDDPEIEQLAVYRLGDGGAMSGLLVAARRSTGSATFLVFLLD